MYEKKAGTWEVRQLAGRYEDAVSTVALQKVERQGRNYSFT